jgi:hypothetical protein
VKHEAHQQSGRHKKQADHHCRNVLYLFRNVKLIAAVTNHIGPAER